MNLGRIVRAAIGATIGSVIAISLATGADRALPAKWPSNGKEALAFILNEPGSVWERTTGKSISFKFLVGKPIIAIFNPYDDTIVNVVCDGKWSLVGPNAYNKKLGAPDKIKAHQVVLVPTDRFDGSCMQSITAVLDGGENHPGRLEIPGDFTNSTTIMFAPADE